MRFISLCLSFTAIAHIAGAATYKVGETTRQFPGDANTNWRGAATHALVTVIWYPAGADAIEKRQSLGDVFNAGAWAENAQMAAGPPKFPLILLSHGTGGSALQFAWLGPVLAAHGFLVAAVNHPGNNATEQYTAAGFALWWERAKDVSTVLDRMLADPQFGPRIDSKRVGAAGFSLGGYTMMELAGATTNLVSFRNGCATPMNLCDGPPEFPDLPARLQEAMKSDARIQTSVEHSSDSYREPRIRAVFAVAPAIAVALNPKSVSQISIPVELVVGSKDPIAPPAENAQWLAKLIPGAKLAILPGASHYTFLDDCTEAGRAKLPQSCATEPAAERRRYHEQVAQMAVAFFDTNLR
jgi:predicted dienelactone hydrolase